WASAGATWTSPLPMPITLSLRRKDQPSVFHIDRDRVALLEFAVEQIKAERIEDAMLNDPLERAGPVGRVVSLRRDLLQRGRSQLQLQSQCGEALHDPVDLNLHDGGKILLVEAVKNDGLINPVEK